MTAPRTDVVQMAFQNPHASQPLTLPVHVVCNTDDETLRERIRINSARRFVQWIGERRIRDRPAVLVGGGPSLADYLDEIRAKVDGDAVLFAMNGASAYLTSRGFTVDYQVIADAKPETATLVDHLADYHLFASQVHPSCFDDLERHAIWHLAIDDMEALFPADRVRRGGYSLIGGGAAVGNAAICLAYVMGFRDFHLYGYDSSHRGEDSHAYDQPMNRFIPVTNVEWAGKTYRSSVAMKAQAEKFQITGQALRQAGCSIHVHGDGLLPAMWNTPTENLTERDKYRMLWQTDSYREVSPGADAVDHILHLLEPDSLILDFGCGTGRASLELARRGHPVLLIDFADNCRDEEAIGLPFLEWDLTRPLPPRADYGICCDVMEHIPEGDVPTVLANITASARTVYFQIATVPDEFGAMIRTRLHLTVRPLEWWMAQFAALGCDIRHAAAGANHVTIVVHTPSDGKQNP